MELYGAAACFVRTQAVLATDGKVLDNAMEVAHKSGIDIRYIERPDQVAISETKSGKEKSVFDTLRERCIMPLDGKTLTRGNGQTNIIRKVDRGGIKRVTSNGKNQQIKIGIFRFAVQRLLEKHYTIRDDINRHYTGRASSGVMPILSQMLFSNEQTPIGLAIENHIALRNSMEHLHRSSI